MNRAFFAVLLLSLAFGHVRAEEKDKADLEVEKKLSKKVSVELKDSSLKAALEYIREQSDAPITLNPAIADEVNEKPVNVLVTNNRIGVLLKVVLDQVDLDDVHQDGEVFISRRGTLEAEATERSVKRNLALTVSFKLGDASVEDALAFLQNQMGAVEIDFDPKLPPEVRKTKVTVNATDTEIERALVLILSPAKLHYRIEGRKLIVISKP